MIVSVIIIFLMYFIIDICNNIIKTIMQNYILYKIQCNLVIRSDEIKLYNMKEMKISQFILNIVKNHFSNQYN